MCETKVKIQVFKKNLHILINLNETRIYKEVLLVHTLALPLHRSCLAFCSMKKKKKVYKKIKKKKKSLAFCLGNTIPWCIWFYTFMLYFVLCTRTLSDLSKIGQTKTRGGVKNFYLRGPNCSTNIFIKTTSYIHIYTCFFIIYTFFLFDKLYIYTHQKKKKRA